jgi:GDP/UDP-N,N'-diacetylbacillosamine 2-epimerase (hydrolysing)
MRKIAVVTGSRADYGLLYWIAKAIHEDDELELQLIVTGMHLSPDFGMTVRVIESDGFPIAERIEMLLSSDTGLSVAISTGLGIMGFAKAYDRLKPDVILVLGDRFEIFAAVSAAVPLNIPVAHIHGGEGTEGTMDELYRHAITKMSHLHFTSAEHYRWRVVQMGESPARVFCVGAPGLDSICRIPLLRREALLKDLGLHEGGRIGIMTYHPATLERVPVEQQIAEVLKALVICSEVCWVITSPNTDTGGRAMISAIQEFVKDKSERAIFAVSLGQIRYLSLLNHADIMVGNSSSGIIEAPSFALPVVNIGDRQRGRLRAGNVIDKAEEIASGIRKALSSEFRTSLQGVKNPYGDGRASERIVQKLKEISLANIVRKTFFDMPVTA